MNKSYSLTVRLRQRNIFAFYTLLMLLWAGLQNAQAQNCDPNIDDFVLQTLGAGLGNSGDNWAASWGDYDRDGYPDLFIVSNEETEPNELYHNNGNGTFTKITTGPIATDRAPSLAASWGGL